MAKDDPIIGLPGVRRYVLPGGELGDAARPEMDTYGLAAVLEEIREDRAGRSSSQ